MFLGHFHWFIWDCEIFTLYVDDVEGGGALRALVEDEEINGVASSCTRWALRLKPRTSAKRASYCDTGNITIFHLQKHS